MPVPTYLKISLANLLNVFCVILQFVNCLLHLPFFVPRIMAEYRGVLKTCSKNQSLDETPSMILFMLLPFPFRLSCLDLLIKEQMLLCRQDVVSISFSINTASRYVKYRQSIEGSSSISANKCPI